MAEVARGAPPFVPGLELADAFYREAVRPILADAFPGLQHAAALIGPGSEVLGFDTAMSTDHGWGPRVLLFLSPHEDASRHEAIRRVLARRLPRTFMGYPTAFTEPDPGSTDSPVLHVAASGPVRHRVETHRCADYLEGSLGVRAVERLQPEDWLLIPQQKLLSLVAGRVFHDDVGLEELRRRLAWYPRDVWIYLLASAWSRIGEEEHLMGRAGFVGDELGSSIIGSRLVRDVMRLAFLMERVYAPYAKWLGTAFRRLRCASPLGDALGKAATATTWQEREAGLVAAYERLACMHAELELTPTLPTRATSFHDRPFQVIHAERYAQALVAEIQDERVRRIAQKRLIGNVDMITDSTDLLEDGVRIRALRSLYP